ncbi:hypothetical protein BN7_5167 [Wickerhamomyces ciferrii]|uniref:Anaphase-promoting complex subunit 11 n=1 Tax=Wickerhamomyces ciferrii (strain ATCC 14091 / BCRC 22168 / CBS 111 / JCM 3599 / NBRC 0793 / NRRL Y-1031 F-60-10) TaxID=1206466 RepID=K0KVR8_WICCF|nr:uncharacterized protein BN7_5167 [Wickerhamomyces ciferrii]CCH45584.1 hypothetical protein BN7_5167 [Wickerhamomyces ciferrii]
MLVDILEWNGVATWSWDVPSEEVCGICRVSFDATCSNCKIPGDQCPLVVGECTHRFHMHCIVKWLEIETSKNLCPMCRRSFKAVHGEKQLGGSQVLSYIESFNFEG